MQSYDQSNNYYEGDQIPLTTTVTVGRTSEEAHLVRVKDNGKVIKVTENYIKTKQLDLSTIEVQESYDDAEPGDFLYLTELQIDSLNATLTQENLYTWAKKSYKGDKWEWVECDENEEGSILKQKKTISISKLVLAKENEIGELVPLKDGESPEGYTWQSKSTIANSKKVLAKKNKDGVWEEWKEGESTEGYTWQNKTTIAAYKINSKRGLAKKNKDGVWIIWTEGSQDGYTLQTQTTIAASQRVLAKKNKDGVWEEWKEGESTEGCTLQKKSAIASSKKVLAKKNKDGVWEEWKEGESREGYTLQSKSTIASSKKVLAKKNKDGVWEEWKEGESKEGYTWHSKSTVRKSRSQAKKKYKTSKKRDFEKIIESEVYVLKEMPCDSQDFNNTKIAENQDQTQSESILINNNPIQEITTQYQPVFAAERQKIIGSEVISYSNTTRQNQLPILNNIEKPKTSEFFRDQNNNQPRNSQQITMSAASRLAARPMPIYSPYFFNSVSGANQHEQQEFIGLTTSSHDAPDPKRQKRNESEKETKTFAFSQDVKMEPISSKQTISQAASSLAVRLRPNPIYSPYFPQQSGNIMKNNQQQGKRSGSTGSSYSTSSTLYSAQQPGPIMIKPIPISHKNNLGIGSNDRAGTCINDDKIGATVESIKKFQEQQKLQMRDKRK